MPYQTGRFGYSGSFREGACLENSILTTTSLPEGCRSCRGESEDCSGVRGLGLARPGPLKDLGRTLAWAWWACARVCVCVLCAKSLQSCPTLCDPMDCSPSGFSVHRDSRGRNTGEGCHSPLQEIFSTQGSNPRRLHGQVGSYLGSRNLGLVPTTNNSLVLDQTEELFPSLGLFSPSISCQMAGEAAGV